MIILYEYSKCSTCKSANRFLKGKGVEFKSRPIVETPPTVADLKKMLGIVGSLKKLFNTSGLVYREMKLGEKFDKMSEAEALHLLASNGKLIKRPFLLTAKGGAVGFNEAEWKKLF